MDHQHFQIAQGRVMSDPEWIALESISEDVKRFIFDDTMLTTLKRRGLAEPSDGRWRVTAHGRQALTERARCSQR
jgi:hypothetical protein